MTEEIVLRTNDFRHEPLAPPSGAERVISHQLVCRAPKSGEPLAFSIINDRFLEIVRRQKKTGDQQQICIYLGLLKSKPTSRWQANYWMAALILAAGLICSVGFVVDYWSLMILSTVLGLLSLYKLCSSFRRLIVLRSAVAQAALAEIPKAAQGRKAFVSQLVRKIHDNPVPADVNAMAEEIKMLRQAMEKGFIKKVDYERCRAYILAQQ